jgi:hypothetical protein
VSRLAEVLKPKLMGELRPRPFETRSGRGKLVDLDDRDVPQLTAGDVLVTAFAYGLGPVIVDGVHTGIAGEEGNQYEVPVIDALIPTGQRLAFAPEELCRVREVRA